jgi:hypothetical protein
MSQHAVSEPPRGPVTWLLGALVGVIVAGAFVGYAFLSPAVYRASAIVEVWPSNPQSPARVEPLEGARRLHDAILDRDVLETIAKERAASTSGQPQAELASGIESALKVDTLDGATYTLSFFDSDRARAAKTCNWLASRLAERAPHVLGPDTAREDRAIEGERRRRVNAVVTFLAAHPELAGLDSQSAASDLISEKKRIEARLEAAKKASPSASAADEDPALLGKRLAELNAAIQARSNEKPADAKDKKAAPAAAKELQQLLAELARAREASKKAASREPSFKARVVSTASTPTWPVEPDRPRVLLMGLAAAIVSGLLGPLLVRRRREDEGDSAPPPSASSFPPENERSYPRDPGVPHIAGLERLGAVDVNAPTFAIAAEQPVPPPAAAEQPVTAAPEQAPHGANGQTMSDSDPPPMNQGDRVTPVSAFPLRVPGGRSDGALRAALEVNVPTIEKTPPTADAVPVGSPHTTHVLGSPIPPIIAPGSRRSFAPGTRAGATPVPATSYSYVSTPPPPAGPSSQPRGAARTAQYSSSPYSSGPPTRRYVSSPPAPVKDGSVVSVERTPTGWRPDLALLPESRRNLCDEIYPFAVEGCCVLGVLGGNENADAKSRLAAELALALAESGHTRVLLLEGDPQRANVNRFLRVEMPRTAGFSEQLQSRVSTGLSVPWVVLECSQSLHALAEGEHPSPDLILSQAFEDCVRELRRYYDFIVIDGPSVSSTPACRAVHDVIDRVVFSHGRFGPSELATANQLFPGKRMTVVPASG